jgi:hypothetical protein
MNDSHPQTDDTLVKTFLENALSLLREAEGNGHTPSREELAAVESLLAKGQFKLALNALAEVGKQTTPRAKFWHSLSNAARELGLSSRAEDFQFLWVQAASLALEREVKGK